MSDTDSRALIFRPTSEYESCSPGPSESCRARPTFRLPQRSSPSLAEASAHFPAHRSSLCSSSCTPFPFGRLPGLPMHFSYLSDQTCEHSEPLFHPPDLCYASTFPFLVYFHLPFLFCFYHLSLQSFYNLPSHSFRLGDIWNYLKPPVGYSLLQWLPISPLLPFHILYLI